jgi:hypothetical protein
MTPLLISSTPFGKLPLIVKAAVELPAVLPEIVTLELIVASTLLVPFQPALTAKVLKLALV